jgi:hypothetical protein
MAELERDLERLIAGDHNVGLPEPAEPSVPVLPRPRPGQRWHLGVAAVLAIGVGLAVALVRTEDSPPPPPPAAVKAAVVPPPVAPLEPPPSPPVPAPEAVEVPPPAPKPTAASHSPRQKKRAAEKATPARDGTLGRVGVDMFIGTPPAPRR